MTKARRVFAALPSAVFAGVFLVTWIAPDALGDRMVVDLLIVVLVEFIVIHSAPFMGLVLLADQSRKKKITGVLVLGMFYSTFALGFALGFGVWWPLWAFWCLIANRLVPSLVLPPASERSKQILMASWGIGVLCYLLAMGLALLPWPRLGITPEVVSALKIPGEGEFVDQPHLALVAGLLYFAGLALSTYWLHGKGKWLAKHAAVRMRSPEPVAARRRHARAAQVDEAE